ncbi:MAG: zf-HC2 domain-containing protein [Thermoanaerobaculaceae bacterium]|jgi:anti-sigma-K factor RskA
MTSCLEVRRLAPRFVALELSPGDEREFREHLAGCAACREAVAASEPTLALAWRIAAEAGPAEDERFVSEVLGQIHQRQLEHRLRGRRSWVVAAAAAAVLVAVLGGTAVVRQLSGPPATSAVATVAATRPGPAATEPAFIEVEGAGVRLYQLAQASQSRDAIQVAFIVDPHLEL